MAVDDSYTKSLLHFEGSNGSTTFIDESGKAWTANGDAQISTAQIKFGISSGLFDGTGDYISTPNSADFDFGSDNWTIDLWIWRDGTKAYPYAFSLGKSGGNGLGIGLGNSNNKMRIIWDAAEKINGSSTIADQTWTHIIVERSGATVFLYVNGNVDGSAGASSNMNSDGQGAVIGRLCTDLDNYYWKGHIAEARVSKGIARTLQNIVPTKKYGPEYPIYIKTNRNRFQTTGISLGS
jgi:hypothetical protein